MFGAPNAFPWEGPSCVVCSSGLQNGKIKYSRKWAELPVFTALHSKIKDWGQLRQAAGASRQTAPCPGRVGGRLDRESQPQEENLGVTKKASGMSQLQERKEQDTRVEDCRAGSPL